MRRLAMTLRSRAVAVVSLVSIAVATTSAFQARRPGSLLLDRAYINDLRGRAQKGDAAIRAAITTLEEDARKALAIKPMSVMDKAITPPSGDKHDYMSQAPYWWPDPAKFFFSSRRRHTRFDCDWSSDVCSSDLAGVQRRAGAVVVHRQCVHASRAPTSDGRPARAVPARDEVRRCATRAREDPAGVEIGRASCRERV